MLEELELPRLDELPRAAGKEGGSDPVEQPRAAGQVQRSGRAPVGTALPAFGRAMEESELHRGEGEAEIDEADTGAADTDQYALGVAAMVVAVAGGVEQPPQGVGAEAETERKQPGRSGLVRDPPHRAARVPRLAVEGEKADQRVEQAPRREAAAGGGDQLAVTPHVRLAGAHFRH